MAQGTHSPGHECHLLGGHCRWALPKCLRAAEGQELSSPRLHHLALEPLTPASESHCPLGAESPGMGWDKPEILSRADALCRLP